MQLKLNLKSKIKKILENRLCYLFLIFIFFIFLGLLDTYPLILHITDYLPPNHIGNEVNSYCDTLQTYYFFWLFKDNLLNGKNILYNQYEFSIGEYRNFRGLWGFPLTILFLVLSFFGDVFAYNVLIIFSFAFSGLGMYLLVEFMTRNKYSGLISGVIYSMAPFRVGEIVIYGHIGGFIALFLPFVVYFYEKAFTKKSFKDMIFAGICILMVAFTEWHITYYIFLFTLLYLPFKVLQLTRNKDVIKKFEGYSRIFSVLLIFVTLSIGYIMHCKSQSQLDEFGGWNPNAICCYPHPFYFFVRDPGNEFYLGIFPIAIILTVLIQTVKTPRNLHVWFYTLIFLGSLILTLGPNFPLPNFSPYMSFYKFMPFFDHFRSPARIAIMVVFSLAILSGFAVNKFLRIAVGIPKKITAVIIVLLVLLIVLDYTFAPLNIGPVDENNQVYRIVKESEDDSKILEIPIISAGWPGNSVYEYYITLHKKSIINGYSPFPHKEYVELKEKFKSINLGKINKSQYRLMKEKNIDFIIVHRRLLEYKRFNTSMDRFMESPYLEFIKNDKDIWLFKVN